MEFKADLHCHSYFSDGSDSPEELIKLAKATQLQGLSITDHDTVDAYKTAFELAKREGILLLPGIEFSAALKDEAIHILGYGIVVNSQAIEELCAKHQLRRFNRNLKILRKLKELGIHIEQEELYDQQIHPRTIGRPHIGQILVDRGIVRTLQESFEKYLGEGRAAYDPGEPISVEETIDAIHAAKGKAIIAHPHLIKKRSILRVLLKMPFDGLEGYYARFTKSQDQEWLDKAKERNWLVTGGSDYHGKNKPMNYLGSSWVDKECFDKLYGSRS